MRNIGVVVVTYNRKEKLKKTLAVFDMQTYLMDYVIVVDNASTDGTGDYLKEWSSVSCAYEKIIITMPYNAGGSGGFFAGLEKAQEKKSNWIWVSDDDAFPEVDALENAYHFLQNNKELAKNIAAICGMVLNYGEIDTLHRRSVFQKGLGVKEIVYPQSEYKKNSFEINCFSYVGTLINRNKLSIAGLPEKDYFIWMDDTEHSLRLCKTGKIICVPSIKIHHDIGNSNEGLNWKLYYSVRNYLDLCRRHFSPNCYNWCCFYTIFKTYIKDILQIDKQKNQLIRCAVKDARKKRLGVHSVYRPGWKPEKA